MMKRVTLRGAFGAAAAAAAIAAAGTALAENDPPIKDLMAGFSAVPKLRPFRWMISKIPA